MTDITSQILSTSRSLGYELLDSGDGYKLERFGDIVLARPDPQVLWKKMMPQSLWDSAQAIFIRKGKSAKWDAKKELAKAWLIDFGGFTFEIRPTSFKHTGLFPEQSTNWEWIAKQIKNEQEKRKDTPVKILNLFGYTGGATLAALRAGAEVVHVDGSKTAVGWARKNAELSGLADRPVRWIVDDVRTFLKREIKRGNRYDGIILDPPTFGYGPSDELWKIEEHMHELVELVRQTLSTEPIFILVNGYAAGYSPISYHNIFFPLVVGTHGNIEYGELAIEESTSKRLLPSGIFWRYTRS